MRRAVWVLGAVVSLLTTSLSAGAWLECVRNLRDSLSGVSYVDELVYDSVHNRIFVGGEGIVVIDGLTDQRVMMMRVGADRIGYNPARNKLYAAARDLSIIDAASGQVLRSYPYGADYQAEPAFAYSPPGDKMYYIPDHDVGSVVVLDGVTDSILALIPVGHYPLALAYNWRRDKLYCACLDDSIAVIDCATDSIVTRIPSGDGIGYRAIAYNDVDDKIYCGSVEPGLSAIDCATDSIVAEVGIHLAWYLTYNPAENKLYCLQGDSPYIWVVDCAGDSILGWVQMPGDRLDALGLWCNPVANKAYVACYRNDLVVVDCHADTVVARDTVGVFDFIVPFCHNPVDNKTYCGNNHSGTVSVVDGGSDSVITTVIVSGTYHPQSLCYDSVSDHVYCLQGYTGAVTPIDAAYIRVHHARSVGVKPSEMVGAGGKFYIGDEDAGGITVFGGDDTVIGRITEPPGLQPSFCYVEPAGKLYCRVGDSTLASIDVSADTVLATLELGVGAFGLLYNPLSGLLYARCIPGMDTILQVDVSSDSVVGVIGFPFRISGWALNLSQNVLYVRGYEGNVAVVDGESNVIDTVIVAPPGAGQMLWNPANNCVYYMSDGSLVVVIDCSTNEVVAYLQVGPTTGFFACDTLQNRVYCSCSSAVWVIDGETNLSLGPVDIGGPAAANMVWVPRYNRLYLVSSDSTISVIRDVVGIEEVSDGEWRVPSQPTIVRGCLRLPAADGGGRSVVGVLVNSVGRRVMELTPGDNDVRGLAPGVYFVREEGPRVRGAEGSRVRKVVIAR